MNCFSSQLLFNNNAQDEIFQNMSSSLVDIGLDTADNYARCGTAPRLKNKKKNRPIFFELLRLVNANIIPFVE